MARMSSISERKASAGALLDVAKYNAAALPALTTGNGDNTLVFGDPQISGTEYEPCPFTLVLNTFFDGAADPVLPGTTVTTTLAIVPCSVDYSRLQPSNVTVKYTIINEFEQSFSASHGAVQAQTVNSLADIARVFTSSVAGTLTGQARIVGVEGGVLGVALEAHRNGAASRSAGLNLNAQGSRFPDTVVLPPAQ